MDEETERKIGRICKRVFRTLHLRDYARIDLRLRPDGKILAKLQVETINEIPDK